MRIRRIALLSAVAAAIGGAVLWKRSKVQTAEEEDTVIDLESSSNGGDVSEAQQQKTDSTVPL